MRSTKRSVMESSRAGLTLKELVVVLFICGLLFIMIIGLTDNSRTVSRRLQCLNNLRIIGLAMNNYATNHNGHFPPITNKKGAWPVELLIYLDNQPLYNNWNNAEVLGEKDPGEFQLIMLNCPDDKNNLNHPGGLSYVVNAGYGDFILDEAAGRLFPGASGSHDGLNIDWDRDGTTGTAADFAIARTTGLFWPVNKHGAGMTISEITLGDGLAQTLMLSESLNAGAARNWSDPDLMNHAFVVGANINPTTKQSRNFGTATGPLAITGGADFSQFTFNSDQGNKRGGWPSPSSNHSGIVNVIFADGRGQALSEDIDREVYIRLISPAGEQHGQQPVTESDY